MEKEKTPSNLLALKKEKINQFLSQGRVSLAKEMLLSLQEDLPFDSELQIQLSHCYILEKKYSQAISFLEKAPIEEVHQLLAALYLKDKKEENSTKLFHLYQSIYKNHPEDPYSKNASHQVNYKRLRIYMEKQFNPNFYLNRKSLNYTERQLFHYDPQEAIAHVLERHSYRSSPLKSRFYQTELIPTLFDSVKQYIESNPNQGILRNNCADTYVFFLPHCGIKGKKSPCNFLYVFTILNRPDILSMYPCSYKEEVPIYLFDEIKQNFFPEKKEKEYFLRRKQV